MSRLLHALCLQSDKSKQNQVERIIKEVFSKGGACIKGVAAKYFSVIHAPKRIGGVMVLNDVE